LWISRFKHELAKTFTTTEKTQTKEAHVPSPAEVLKHPIFGRVRGKLAERAKRHDELLGLDKPKTGTSEEAATLAVRMKEYVDRVVEEVSKFLKGEQVAERVRFVIQAILTRSHVLLEGASGTGKTRAVSLVARILDIPFERIDALPDLSDLDIIGGEVFEDGRFRLKRSALLRPLILMIIDEFGRLSATCANAFLQALEEREVNISDLRGSGTTRLSLSPAFVVAAAMNPQAYGGSGGINEALFDRISVGLRMPMPDDKGLGSALTGPMVKVTPPWWEIAKADKRWPVAPEEEKKDEPEKIPPPYTLLQIWSAIDFVTVPPKLIEAIIHTNYLVSPPAFRKSNLWTECSFKPDAKEKKAIEKLENETTKYLFEGSNPRGMVLTVQQAKSNAFFRGSMVVNANDVRRAAEAALLFRLKSYPGTSPAVISEMIDRAVNLAIPKGKGDA
jgi:MoxR-like ATPase